jgi:phosphatidate cytidylyltransferase
MKILQENKEYTELTLRTISSFAIVALIVSSILAGKLCFNICISIMCAGMIYELLSVARRKDAFLFAVFLAIIQFCSLNTVLGCLFCAQIALTAIFFSKYFIYIIITFALLAFFNNFFYAIISTIIMTLVLFYKQDFYKEITNLKHKFIVLLGLVYIFVSMHILGKIYNKFGFIFVIWMFLCIWLTDTGAFFIGRMIGGKKLAPRISPGKTWAGFWGGIFTAEIVCSVIGMFLVPKEQLYKIELLTVIMSTAAIIGDLFESYAKRYFNVKDMGQIIPGHGGLTDRFDSLLMVSLVLSIFLYI